MAEEGSFFFRWIYLFSLNIFLVIAVQCICLSVSIHLLCVNSDEQTFWICPAFCNIDGLSLQGENLRFLSPLSNPTVPGLLFSQFPSLCSVTEIHTTCLTYLLVTLVTPYVSSLVIFCSRAWILKISVLAGGSFWDCIEVIEVLGAKKAASVSCWWIVEHPLVVRSQINRHRWSLAVWGDLLILE